ncbi:choice-of-anchor M domain-containing protein [Corynebacterium aurimucosum]|uniref:choice-of-anchor M domain-containing protein n=1 Tax=Corynebacterium aurimucosum TaxID=169292 RepID=UPI00187AA150|nr:choice-of-anchor M domain-containing protein [Corynebacterium aurimucosum]MBE7364679.1 choice-of-anchor M domain-containing protein [Corynebacterium aurimucosum]
MNSFHMTRMSFRPLTLTAVAALALSTPPLVAAAPPALAEEHASEASCDADSLHAFTRGHQDLALVGDSGDLSFIARDDESGKDYASGEFYVEVGSNAAFDESAGSDIPSSGWQIPQTQDPNIPWVGFNTSYLDESTAADATLSLTLHSGPEGGRMVGFQNTLGAAPTVLFDSDNPDITWDYPDHFHSHTGIIFTEPGAYAATFTFTLNDGSEHSIDVPFLVGGTDASDICELEWDSSEGDDAGSGSPKNRPQQLAKDINDTSKSVAQLDKTMDKTLKEADTLLNGGKPSESSRAQDSRHSTRPSARSKAQPGTSPTSKEPSTERPTDGQRSVSQSQNSAQNGVAHTAQGQRDSAHRGASPSTASSGEKGSTRNTAANRERGAKQEAQQQHSASDSNEDYADAENIQAMSYGAPMVGFWAGFLAGMGSLALLLGIGLFVAVQFFRPRNRD